MLQTSSFNAIAHPHTIHPIDMNISNSIGDITTIQKNLNREALPSRILDGTNLIEEKPLVRQLDEEKIDLVNLPEFAASVLSIYLAIAAGALIVFGILHKRVQSHITTDLLSSLKRVPCIHCHFFTMNPYLRCAVNPVTVLTKEAIDCSDYRPRNSKHLY